MLKPFAVVVLCAGAILAVADQLQTEWQKRYDALSAMVRARDFKGFQGLIGDGYVWVLPDGSKKNRTESIAAFAPVFEMSKVTGGEIVKKVVRNHDAIEVTFDANWTATGKDGKINRDHEVGVDTWRQLGGRWQVVRTVDKSVTF